MPGTCRSPVITLDEQLPAVAGASSGSGPRCKANVHDEQHKRDRSEMQKLAARSIHDRSRLSRWSMQRKVLNVTHIHIPAEDRGDY